VPGNALKVEESSGQRWNLALQLLADGETVILRGVSLTLRPQVLEALVQSTWDLEHATAETARADIARGERVVGALLESSEEFAKLVGDRTVEYRAIDDYGMGAIWFAELRDGRFQWAGP
jgi:hypothetical protein